MDEGEPWGPFTLARLLEELGRLDEAEAWYRTASAAGDGRADLNLGNILAGQGRVGEAADAYRGGIAKGDDLAAGARAELEGR